MGYKIFRIVVLIAALIPGGMAASMAFLGMFESFGILSLMFGSAFYMYIEFAYNTVKLFQDKK